MSYRLVSMARLRDRLAYLMLRAWWLVRRPATHSAGIALWYRGKVLMVRTSSRAALSLPGGLVKAGQPSDLAARQELLEDLGITLPAGGLRLVWQGKVRFESRLDAMNIWEMGVQDPPRIQCDGRRIIGAEWMAPAEAMKKRLSPPVMLYLLEKSAGLIVDWSPCQSQSPEPAAQYVQSPAASSLSGTVAAEAACR